MADDEQGIRDLIDNWLRATATGDIADLMQMMAEDVVFLTPGQAPMGRDEFATGFLAAIEHVRIEASANVQEIDVAGDFAYCLELPGRGGDAAGGRGVRSAGPGTR